MRNLVSVGKNLLSLHIAHEKLINIVTQTEP